MSVNPPQCHQGEGHCAASSTKAPVIGAKCANPIAALATAYQRGCDRAPHTIMAPVPKTSPNPTSDADGPKGACSCATRHKPAPFQRLDKAMCVHWTHKGVRIAAMKVMAWCGTFGAGMGIGRFFIGDFIRLCCVSEVRSSLGLCRNKPERQSCALSQVNELGDGGGRRLTPPCRNTPRSIPDLHFSGFGTVDFNQKGPLGQAAWRCSRTPSRHTLPPRLPDQCPAHRR